jgi:thiamine pyrophosphokinase
MKAVIIANGDIRDYSFIKSECTDADVVICADGGAEHAARCGIVPEYLIGDLDSVSSTLADSLEKSGVKVIRYPAEKDFTDTEICINKAIELGCEEICIAAGVGDRMDHSLGNIGLLHVIREMGMEGYIFSSDAYIFLCTDEIWITGRKGDTISIIPLSGSAEGLYSEGLKYKLDNLTIPFGKPLGVSNVMTENKCRISVGKGEVLVIKQNNI